MLANRYLHLANDDVDEIGGARLLLPQIDDRVQRRQPVLDPLPRGIGKTIGIAG
jgi:hypothetical protein